MPLFFFFVKHDFLGRQGRKVRLAGEGAQAYESNVLAAREGHPSRESLYASGAAGAGKLFLQIVEATSALKGPRSRGEHYRILLT